MSMLDVAKMVRMLEEVFPERVEVSVNEDGEVVAEVDVSSANVWLHIEDVGSVYVNNVDILEIRARESDIFTDLEVEFLGETDDPYDLNTSFGELVSSSGNSICIHDSGFVVNLGGDVKVDVMFVRRFDGGEESG